MPAVSTTSQALASTGATASPLQPTDLTPDQALALPKQGNAAFQADAPLDPSIDGRRRLFRCGQPLAQPVVSVVVEA